MENQLNKTKSDQNDYDSKAIIKFSFNPKTIQVAHLQFYVEKLNFMKNDTESYNICHGFFQSDGFWSFQTAHVIPDIIGNNVDTASMIVHRIEDTLLTDELDDDKLMITTKDDKALLNQYFNNHNLEFFDLKENCFTHDVKCFKVTQDETFVSWILHCSNGDLTDYDEFNQLQYKKILPFSSSWLGVSLPELTQDDNDSTKSITHIMYNQYMLSTFKGLHLLTGSDLAISNGDNDSQLSLRDMSNPMNASTELDYWLDNLLCNVNELMCEHLNGILKNNKIAFTEDTLYLKNSKFSPNDVKDTAKNLISLLKSNATNIGHTYWLIKEKNSDVLKLYDLTFLNSDTICQNLFTVPTAMQLYRVVRNTKHVQKYGGPSNSNLNHTILVDCLKLLNETKYPEIIVSVCYLLCDIFIPKNTNLKCPNLEDLIVINPLAFDDNANKDSSRKENEFSEFKKLISKPILLTVEERCKKILYCVERSLTSLNSKKKPDVQVVNDENAENVVVLATSVNGKPRRKKNCRNKKKNKAVVKNNNETVYNKQHSLQCIGSKTYILNEAIKFFDKARIAFTALAEQEYLVLRYGNSLKYFQSAYQCQLFISSINGDEDQLRNLLERISACCLLILINWALVEQYINEMKAPDDFYDSTIKIFLGTDCEVCNNYTNYTFIPKNIGTKKYLLYSADLCYNWAMKFEAYNHEEKSMFNTLTGHIFVKLTTDFIKEIYDALTTQNAHKNAIKILGALNDIKFILLMGIELIKTFGTALEAAILHMNMGKWHRYTSQLYVIMSSDDHMNNSCILHIQESINCYLKSMDSMGHDRSLNTILWDEVFWEMFTISYDLAIEKHRVIYAQSDTVSDDNEKEVIFLFFSCLNYCDIENNTRYLEDYKFQYADIHELLADVFVYKLRNNLSINEQTKNQTIRDCIFHYTSSREMFLKIKRPVESLNIINSMIMLDELRFKGTRSAKSTINMFVSIGNTLKECVPALQILMAPENSAWQNIPMRRDMIKLKLSTLLQKIQYTLKVTIKGVIGKNNGLMEKLKPVYRESLTKNDDEHEIAHIIRIINEITKVIE